MPTRVAFKNFKALEEVSIDLERLTVLVGANATGKTTVLEGIHALCTLVRPGMESGTRWDLSQRVFSGRLSREHLSSDGRRRTTQLRLEGVLTCALNINSGSPSHSLAFSVDGKPVALGTPDSERWLDQTAYQMVFPYATFAAFSTEALASPSFVTSADPRVDERGGGLPSVFAEMLANRSPLVERVQDELRRVVPLARRLRVVGTSITRQENEVLTINGQMVMNPVQRTYRGHLLELELAETGFLPVQALSEGTLLVLGLLTLLYTLPRPRIFLLDDIDRGLHPEAQRLVVESLRRFVDEHHDVQVICTSHSPYALDHFRPEEVRVMKADARGRAHCRKLTEHPDWDYWKDSMKPGEFWSSVGEGWVYEEEKDAG